MSAQEILRAAGARFLRLSVAPPAPGAGKTTLVASYLEARRLRHLWYQYDAGDADSATFVHYVRIRAAQLAGKSAEALPRFNSEPQQDLARFVRSFFRNLFSALPAPCLLVFDNFHEPDTTPEQRAAFAPALEELPERAPGVDFGVHRTEPSTIDRFALRMTLGDSR